jgi:hypothetical protein
MDGDGDGATETLGVAEGALLGVGDGMLVGLGTVVGEGVELGTIVGDGVVLGSIVGVGIEVGLGEADNVSIVEFVFCGVESCGETCLTKSKELFSLSSPFPRSE